MEQYIIDTLLSQGVWAVIAYFLFTKLLKSMEQNNMMNKEREDSYKALIGELVERISDLCQIEEKLKEMKKSIETIYQELDLKN